MNTGLVERDQHLRAFARYEAMGRGRSLRRLAEELGVAKSAVEGWSRAFRWRERLEVCRQEVAGAVARHSKQVAEDQMRAARDLVRRGLMQVAKALVQERVNPSCGDVERLIRLKRELEGQGGTSADRVLIVRRDAPPVEDPDDEAGRREAMR